MTWKGADEVVVAGTDRVYVFGKRKRS